MPKEGGVTQEGNTENLIFLFSVWKNLLVGVCVKDRDEVILLLWGDLEASEVLGVEL